jgi:hypothetical protein
LKDVIPALCNVEEPGADKMREGIAGNGGRT